MQQSPTIGVGELADLCGVTSTTCWRRVEKLKAKNIITQKQFLESMGILERARILERKMKFKEKSDLYLRIKRLFKNIMLKIIKS